MTNSAIEKQIFSFNETKTVYEIVELSKIAGIEYDQKSLECENNLECFDDLNDNWEERLIENVVAQDKTKAILFRKGDSKLTPDSLVLFEYPIEWITEVKYLGIKLDNKLNFWDIYHTSKRSFERKLI
ncbi:hypothetical protein AVEN_37389-1 [Araneus ventricosus]|uniref:Uncharacterized protein n=1 Tax=Araneus ventricosus TaxID=182803 RepID=A0A4Y2FIB6_ARAVE|nr:hypothetical protein AVEN_37389-1 [Araneus ventricosus]